MTIQFCHYVFLSLFLLFPHFYSLAQQTKNAKTFGSLSSGGNFQSKKCWKLFFSNLFFFLQFCFWSSRKSVGAATAAQVYWKRIRVRKKVQSTYKKESADGHWQKKRRRSLCKRMKKRLLASAKSLFLPFPLNCF